VYSANLCETQNQGQSHLKPQMEEIHITSREVES